MRRGKPIHGEPLPIARALHPFHLLKRKGEGKVGVEELEPGVDFEDRDLLRL